MSFEDHLKSRECFGKGSIQVAENMTYLARQTSTSKVGDFPYGEVDVESVTATSDSASTAFPVHLRPILVGYAFGPKKMSTMGIIMAEASKTFSTVVTAAVPAFDPKSDEDSPQARNATCSRQMLALATPEQRAEKHRMLQAGDGGLGVIMGPAEVEFTPNLSFEHNICREHRGHSSPPVLESAENVFSTGRVSEGFRNDVFRFVRSSESVASVTESANSGSATIASRPASSTSSQGKTTLPNFGNRLRPVRVSFVPLDLDSPLEEQHGGDFDAILHKLTEDILCLSKMSTETRRSNLGIEFPPRFSGCSQILDKNQAQAIQRVNRLNLYKESHPQCSIVDHPSNVQILMSRSDIARFLSRCLVSVSSTSGIPIGTPRFKIIESEGLHAEALSQLISRAPFGYPLIVKPLMAAGTAESHRMAVVQNPDGLSSVKTPCLLQEYANHDATLFKVYVLGSIVRVFRRPSLPNLPSGEELQKARRQNLTGYVEFDSQRPYPTLSDFGVEESATDDDREKSLSEDQLSRNRKRRHEGSFAFRRETSPRETSPLCSIVTAEEIRPVVDVLKDAFGLELFGFDILVTNCMRHCKHHKEAQKEMLVVDVNYFPSYKEVTNFPSLLAQYLTERAIEGRMKSLNLRGHNRELCCDR